jgi:uncharacterized protein YlxW (UPF0749 family)
MALSVENRNTATRPAILDAEIVSAIADAAASSLSAASAAAVVLSKINGATALQIVAAAIEALREQETRHAEAFAELKGDREGEVSDLEDEVDDLKTEIADLRAKLKKIATEKSAPVAVEPC